MEEKKYYPEIDVFRLAAAFLVIAIHTSPLMSVNETCDFVVTSIISRLAVPFFFMVSGFFLISRYAGHLEGLKRYLRKTGIIYAAATLLYFPVNIYAGYFRADHLCPELIKDILFDGTFYHLWYLPASMLGACIAWYLVRRYDYKVALAITSVLYLAGLFGDSYYGLTEINPFLNGIYNYIFQITDYTRNGIFFAPIFFVLGGYIAEEQEARIYFDDHSEKAGKRRFVKKIRYSQGGELCRINVCGFAVSFLMMSAEAFLLDFFHLQRHDSMYLFLPMCMFFLFSVILHLKGKRHKSFRAAALVIYIIHPFIIVIVRLSAKIFHIQKVLVENSLVHYCLVCILSMISGFIAAAFIKAHRTDKENRTLGKERAYIEINLKNLEHNVRELKKIMPPNCRLMAVVKADAYGHGANEICMYLEKTGVTDFAVATIEEGIRLRKYGIRGDILILGYTSVYRAAELKKYNLMQTLIDYDHAEALNRQGISVKAHIKTDTGMHRLGADAEDIIHIRKMFTMKKIKICGIYTHLCCSDSLKPEDTEYTKEQIERFYRLLGRLEDSGISLPKIHIQSSYGLLNYSELSCDYVRAGIALYGVHSLQDVRTKVQVDLKPVLSVKAGIVSIRSVRKGDSVGYGREFIAERDSRIAVLPIGYADGFPRNLSCGRGSVRINGRYAKIAGRICMDQLMIDITDIENVSVGDIVTLIGADENNIISAPFIAAKTGSISNELLSRLGKRLPIVPVYCDTAQPPLLQ